MTDLAIRVSNLSKLYRIGQLDTHKTLRDVLSNTAKRPVQMVQSWIKGNGAPKPTNNTIWALKDVSFEVKHGEVVGIIGRNGAGKSTLLKILSRITEPTTGRVEGYGRVGSLLEVGTGFHPELTGRENIYLNGAILGMKKVEIDRKFDEIVAFSEIEKFLDTPVKRYSSGMFVRLAFAVAAHLEPEILIVDEVLAVGDIEFQKKCLGKMKGISSSGRTVLFVSHNMAAVEKLCGRGIVLNKGKVEYTGTQTQSISKYLTSFSAETSSLNDRVDRQGSGEIRATAIQIRDDDGNPLDTVTSGQDVDIHIYFEVEPGFSARRINASLMVKTQFDVPVFLQHNRLLNTDFGCIDRNGVFICKIKRLPLPPSTYKIAYSIMPNLGMDGTYYDLIFDAADLTVIDGDFYGSGEVPPITHGCCLVDAEWDIKLN